MSERVTRTGASLAVAVATVAVLIALAIVPFLSPPWIAFAQDRAEAATWTGFTEQELRSATDHVVGDLLTGGDFVIPIGAGALLQDREIAHMRDVQRVFVGFGILAVVAAIGLVGLRRIGRNRWWTAVRAGAGGLAVSVVVLGVIAAVAFEAAFDVFHRLFFSGGNYAFDPRTDRLVQLFPQRFWFETSIAVGALIVLLAAATAWLASRRLRGAPAIAGVPRPGLEPAR